MTAFLDRAKPPWLANPATPYLARHSSFAVYPGFGVKQAPLTHREAPLHLNEAGSLLTEAADSPARVQRHQPAEECSTE